MVNGDPDEYGVMEGVVIVVLVDGLKVVLVLMVHEGD